MCGGGVGMGASATTPASSGTSGISVTAVACGVGLLFEIVIFIC